MRRVLITGAAVLVAIAGVVGLIGFFNSRDSSTTAQQPPAAETTGASSSDPLLRAGNVVVTFAAPADGARLRALAKRLGAPDTPALRAAGSAVIVRRDAGSSGIHAASASSSLDVATPGDPRLQDFVERYLGQGSSG